MINGFRQGFPLGYAGPKQITKTAPNLKLFVGSETELWNKVMKEVQLGRLAGPYKRIPFQHYIQSPIGLVPKAGGKTRLIFHLSYPRSGNSVNLMTPHDICKVKYSDFNCAIKRCQQKFQDNEAEKYEGHLGIKI